MLKVLYDGVSGFGAIIEGAEFLVSHRELWRRLLVPVLASAAATLLARLSIPSLQEAIGVSVPPITLSWYLVLIEWILMGLPFVVASFVAYAALEIAYIVLISPVSFVNSVAEVRGCVRPIESRWNDRLAVAAGVCGATAIWFAMILVFDVAGIPIALLIGFLTLGAGIVWPVLRLRGWTWGEIGRFTIFQSPVCLGLGTAVAVVLTIPAVNLFALPCGFVGATCLVVRAERSGLRSNR